MRRSVVAVTLTRPCCLQEFGCTFSYGRDANERRHIRRTKYGSLLTSQRGTTSLNHNNKPVIKEITASQPNEIQFNLRIAFLGGP
jgi:hypothetical protein